MTTSEKKSKSLGTKPNYLYAIFSVALVLFLLGFFALVILHGQQLIKVSKEKVEIIVEIEDTATEIQIIELKSELNASSFIKAGSIRYISKEEGAKIMQKELGEEFLQLDMPNPLYNILIFNVIALKMHPDSLAPIKIKLKEKEFISDIFYQENIVDAIAQNINKLSWIALGVGIFFIFVAIVLIHNTIRLALYSNRFLIKNMELVGASWESISAPYLWRSLRHGFISALLAIGGLIGLIWLIQHELPEFQELINPMGIVLIFAGLLIVGLLITTLSTYYVVNRYLRMRVDDLY